MQFCEEKNSAYLINCRLHSSRNSLHFITFQYIFKESTLKGGFLFHLIEWALCFNAFLMQFSTFTCCSSLLSILRGFLGYEWWPLSWVSLAKKAPQRYESRREPPYPSAPKGLLTLSIKLPFPQHGQEHV